MEVLPLIATILGSVIQLLRQNETPLPVLDTLGVLKVVLEQGEDVSRDLQALKAEVEAMVEADREPRVEELDRLQAIANATMASIRATATQRLALPSDPE